MSDVTRTLSAIDHGDRSHTRSPNRCALLDHFAGVTLEIRLSAPRSAASTALCRLAQQGVHPPREQATANSGNRLGGGPQPEPGSPF
jgi:hypothetical protein